jgi:hypothetical protein
MAHDAVRIGLPVRARVGSGANGEPCVVFDADPASEGGR